MSAATHETDDLRNAIESLPHGDPDSIDTGPEQGYDKCWAGFSIDTPDPDRAAIAKTLAAHGFEYLTATTITSPPMTYVTVDHEET